MPISPIPVSGNAPDRVTLAGAWELALLTAGRATDPSTLAATTPEWLPAQVPGTAMSALFAAGRADFTRLPALDAQDIWYRCRFDAATAAPGARKLMVFEGLATLAEVWLNGARVLESSNMFLAQGLDVTDALHTNNELLIRFASMQEALKARRPRPRWRTRLVEQQQLRWMRSSLLGRIPGWTPATPAIGPWRAVELRTLQMLVCEHTDVRASLDATTGIVSIALRLRALSGGAPSSARLRIGEVESGLAIRREDDSTFLIEGRASLPGVSIWWPHTHGEPVLHSVAVVVETSHGEQRFDFGKTGFRSIELQCAGDDFALRVNGVPVFCRGACWTTTDILNLTGTEANTRQALLLAKEAGMNMLRVGGTMFYEADHFYALCDELGILLWHDWMFANMDYPADDAGFVASVDAEARQFLRRTQLSPCLALLCGNSEIEQQAAMLGLEKPLWRNRLFSDVLPGLGTELRPDVPYWPSSPAGGVLPFQVDSGAAHYFGVGAYMQPLTDARRCGVRFTSECLAFANVPETETVEVIVGEGQSPLHHPAWKARVPRDSGPGWDFDDVRDHYLAELFKVDPMRLRYADMDRYLALSRVVSGEVMASAFGEWRRNGSTCAGGIVWFFRDLWPGAGWGVVDSLGIPKAAWHYLKRALAPVALFITNEGVNGLALHAVNDTANEISASIALTLYRQGEKAVAEGAQDIRIPARGRVQIRGDALFGHFLDTTYSYRFGPPGHDVAHATLRNSATGELLGSDFFFPLGHAFAVQTDLGLTAQTRAIGDGSYEVTVRSQRFAQAVSVEAPGFRVTDNHFHLQPGGEQSLRLLPRQAGNRLQATLQAINTHQRVKLAPVTAGGAT